MATYGGAFVGVRQILRSDEVREALIPDDVLHAMEDSKGGATSGGAKPALKEPEILLREDSLPPDGLYGARYDGRNRQENGGGGRPGPIPSGQSYGKIANDLLASGNFWPVLMRHCGVSFE